MHEKRWLLLAIFLMSISFVSATPQINNPNIPIVSHPVTPGVNLNTTIVQNGTLHHNGLYDLTPWSSTGHGNTFDIDMFFPNIYASNICYTNGTGCNTFNATYDKWAYNQTTPAITYGTQTYLNGSGTANQVAFFNASRILTSKSWLAVTDTTTKTLTITGFAGQTALAVTGGIVQSAINGNASSTSGTVGITAIGGAGYTNPSGTGGTGGSNSVTGGAGGSSTLNGAGSTGAGGSLTLSGGNSGTATYITGGSTSYATGNAGSVSITTGTGGSLLLSSGTWTFSGGSMGSSGSLTNTIGNGGSVTRSGGSTSSAMVAGNAGSYTLTGGNGGACQASTNTNTGGSGTSITMKAGTGGNAGAGSTTQAIAGVGGSFTIGTGDGGNASGASIQTGGNAGSLIVTTGAGGGGIATNGSGGGINFTTGNGGGATKRGFAGDFAVNLGTGYPNGNFWINNLTSNLFLINGTDGRTTTYTDLFASKNFYIGAVTGNKITMDGNDGFCAGDFEVANQFRTSSLNVSQNTIMNGNLTVYNIKTTGMINTTDGVYIGGNLEVVGNMSVKRYYWTGYDNSTQPLIDINAVQPINISNNDDYDAYGISVVARQNLTFQHTGDYLCILSPEFFEPAGQSGVITFWIQKNGVDVKWSNSRYTLASNTYTAPAIPFQFDIENPATDNIRFMWWSDNANTILYSSGVLTAPSRPSIPAVILNCQKVSELTP